MSTATPKYSVEDRELLMGFYKKLFWNRLVEVIPESLAPNTITVIGQIAALLGTVLAVVATMGYPLLYVVSAFLLLVYLTADNIDGAHARRTGQTSSLGEFLDHGLDGVANGCVLLTAAVVLRMDGIWMVMLLALGALGFIFTFWEQYRTGKLILPEMSATEGVTLVMLVELVLFFAGEPAWLRFDMTAMNVATYIMLFTLAMYGVALAQPTWRIYKHTGGKIGEGLPALTLAAAACGYVAAGAAGPMPAIMVALYGADTVCRLIWLRHQGADRQLVGNYHYLLALPLLPAAAGLWTPDAWAALAMGMSLAFYMRTLLKAGAAFNSLTPDQMRSA